jgi:hypothetical protein
MTTENDNTDYQLHDPIPAIYVRHGNGTNPEPPMDPEWSDLDKLRWKAGLIEHEIGVRIRIATGCHRFRNGDTWITDFSQYGWSYSTPHRAISGASRSFHDMWEWMVGIVDGYTLHPNIAPHAPPPRRLPVQQWRHYNVDNIDIATAGDRAFITANTPTEYLELEFERDELQLIHDMIGSILNHDNDG